MVHLNHSTHGWLILVTNITSQVTLWLTNYIANIGQSE